MKVQRCNDSRECGFKVLSLGWLRLVEFHNDSDGHKVYVHMNNASAQLACRKVAFRVGSLRAELSFSKVSYVPRMLKPSAMSNDGPESSKKNGLSDGVVLTSPECSDCASSAGCVINGPQPESMEAQNQTAPNVQHVAGPSVLHVPEQGSVANSVGQCMGETDSLQIGQFASVKLHGSNAAFMCKVSVCIDAVNRVYEVMFAQDEASKLLCANGVVKRVDDSRGVAYVAYHPAFPAELGLASGQKWFGVRVHGGEEKTKRLAESRLTTWRSQFILKAQQSLTAKISLCKDGECTAAGAQTGEVNTCVEWHAIPSDSFEGRLIEKTGVWSQTHASESADLACIVRALCSKRAMQQALKSSNVSSSPSASPKSKAARQSHQELMAKTAS